MNQMKISCQNCLFSRAKAFNSSITFFVTPCFDFQMVVLLTFKMVAGLNLTSVRTACTIRNTIKQFVRYVYNIIQLIKKPRKNSISFSYLHFGYVLLLPLKGVNWVTWCELGQNLVNRHRCDCC